MTTRMNTQSYWGGDSRIWWGKHRWLVEIDGRRSTYRTRREAMDAQRWENRHPANTNIRIFGPYRNGDGKARLIDLGAPCPDRASKGLCAYRLEIDQ